MELNNREIALLFWLGVLVVCLVVNQGTRQSLGAVIRAFFQPQIVGTVIGLFAWIVGLIFLASKLGLWNWDLVNDTVIWSLASFALLFNSNEVLEREDFFQRKFATALRVTIAVEVFVNLVVLPLPVELVLIPAVTFLTMLSAFSASDKQYEPARKLVDGTITAVGLCLLFYVAASIALNPGQLNETSGLRFALPVWLSLGVLPYIYLVGLYAGYDAAFSRIRFMTEDRNAQRRAKRALFWHCHFRARRIGEFKGHWLQQLASANSVTAAREVLDRFELERRQSFQT